jgi:hypothetical protein
MAGYVNSPFAAPGLVWPQETVEQIEEMARAGELDVPSGAAQREPVIVQLGDNPDSYLAITFEAGAVVMRDSNDPSGKAVQVSYDQWRAYVSELRGDGADSVEQAEKDTGAEEAPGDAHPGADHIPPGKTIKTHSRETDARVSTPGEPGSGDDDRK